MCTIVTIAKNGVVLAGNNEDFTEPRTKIWFIPASKGAYGRVYVGFDFAPIHSRFQGGMNDQGLFVDMNAVKPTGWRSELGRPSFQGDLVEQILSTYCSVDEVVKFFQQHDVPDLNTLKVPVADAKGNSVIVEWGKKQLQFLYKENCYQISTNFVQSNYESIKEYPCERYKIADHILRNATAASVDLVRAVLSATHSEHISPTLYSNICDLKKKTIHLYLSHNFEEEVVFDLDKELKKGEAEYSMRSLFSIIPYAAYQFSQFGPQIGADALMRIIHEKGIKEALRQFEEMRRQSRNIPRYVLEEWVLRDVALKLSSSNQSSEAVEIFKLNAKLHPESQEANRDLSVVRAKKHRRI
ncbi:MAG: hypothetical protein JSV64_00675 [Candidatus Bathyarchaeota archaeon]|nr:MAG: hypothetical protein JSV64_00675 [Candidatus Bathyarchaeota archaeon]